MATLPRYEGTGPPYNPGPGQHWEYTVTILHHDAIPAAPATYKSVPTGNYTKKYSIEQRTGFGFSGTLFGEGLAAGTLTKPYEQAPLWAQVVGGGAWYPIAKLLGL